MYVLKCIKAGIYNSSRNPPIDIGSFLNCYGGATLELDDANTFPTTELALIWLNAFELFKRTDKHAVFEPTFIEDTN